MSVQDPPVTPSAAVVVEAGDEPWARIRPLLDRRCAELPADGLLEVRLHGLDTLAELVAWCAAHQHLQAELDPGGTVVRLRTAPHPTPRRTA
ncbi:hypothetical protein ATJ88_0365 [Isoptericola jiangsuensis]|uniref:Sulfurtransferase TusA family protein n=1 Tax=Isoptericola jiangsuensis TaxID=548579 RepID=A0A2A9ESJ2_9MICO|nr:hypothetical protein [Isoptericola jiangsuensis]PFG41723.1 hypothetical protein ATJ88_0365 [Isoptericola jiangsuensis]